MADLVSRQQLLMAALYCGGCYAVWRIVLTVTYPFVVCTLWQHVIGPHIIKRYPHLGQSDDVTRSSYIAMKDEHPDVIATASPQLDDVTHGIRDGAAYGVIYALLPEFIQGGFLAMVLLFVLMKSAYRIGRTTGSAKTDCEVSCIKEVLMYTGAILSMQAAQFFHH